VRKISIAVVAVLVLLVAGLGVAVWNLDAYVNANREAVAERVEQALGREVSFGEVGITFLGGLGVSVADLRVGEDAAFAQGDFLRAGGVDVRIEVLPALFGRIQVDRVVLRDPDITVIRSAKGFSTDSLGGAAPAEAPAEAEGPPPAVLVALVDIRGGKLRFVDRTVRPANELVVTALDFSASDLGLDKPVDFELAAAVLGAEQVNLRASGRVGPLGSDAPQADLKLRLDPLDVGAALRVPGVAEAIPPELDVQGPVGVELSAEGSLENLRFELQLDAEGADLRYGESFSKPRGTPFALDVRGTRSGGALALEPAELTLGDAKLRAKATVTEAVPRGVDFYVSSESLPLASVGAAAATSADVVRGLEMKGKVSLHDAGPKGGVSVRSSGGSVSDTAYEDLSAELRLAGTRAVVEKMSLRVFGGSLAGSAAYDWSGRGRLEFDLTMDALPLAALGAAAPGSEDVLRALEAQGKVSLVAAGREGAVSARSSSGTVYGASYEDLTADLGLDGSRAHLRKLAVRAFGGSLDASGVLDDSDGVRKLSDGRVRLAGVAIPKLLEAYAPASAGRLTGTLGASLGDLRTAGASTDELLRALAGSGSVTLRDGVVRDFNPAGETLRELARLPVLAGSKLGRVAEAHPQVFGVGDTAFENLDGRLEIRDGWVEARDFRLAASDYVLEGAGRISLLDQKVDARTSLVFSDALSGELVAAAKPLRYMRTPGGRVALPVRVGGQLGDLAVHPDVAAVAQAAGREAVSDLLSKTLAPKPSEPAPDEPVAPGEAGEPTAPGEPAPAPAQPSVEDLGGELIRRGLGGLLGGGSDD
jgi:uncharacterized protein involved in outer membrane biogenesis